MNIAGKRGVPFSGSNWAVELKDNIKKTDFKGSWKDAVLIKDELEELAKKNKKYSSKENKKKKFSVPYENELDDMKEYLSKNKDRLINYLPYNGIPLFWNLLKKYEDISEIIKPPISKLGEYYDKNKKPLQFANAVMFNLGELEQSILLLDHIYSDEWIMFRSDKLKEIVKNTDKKFICLLLAFKVHCNAIIINTEKKIFELYEPAGYYGDDKTEKEIDLILKELCESLDLTYKRNIGGYLNEHLDFDKFYSNLNKKEINIYKKIFSEDKRVGFQRLEYVISPDLYYFNNLCFSWSLLHIEMRLLNPELSEKKIMKKFVEFIDSNRDNLENYVLFYILKSNDELIKIFGRKDFMYKYPLLKIFDKIMN